MFEVAVYVLVVVALWLAVGFLIGVRIVGVGNFNWRAFFLMPLFLLTVAFYVAVIAAVMVGLYFLARWVFT